MYIRSAEEAERNAAKQMRYLGYLDAHVTLGGPDAGIDVRSSQAVAQVKWKTAQTGRPELQNLYGARGADHHLQLLFFSASGYSKSALEYAQEHLIALFTYQPDGELNDANELADNMLDAAWERERLSKIPPNTDPWSSQRNIIERYLREHPDQAYGRPAADATE